MKSWNNALFLMKIKRSFSLTSAFVTDTKMHPINSTSLEIEVAIATPLAPSFGAPRRPKIKTALNRIFSIKGVSPTLTTKNDAVYSEINGHLTGRERFKLQGFNPDYVDILIEKGLTKGLIDKVSGNTITVNVLEEIFKNLFLKSVTN